MVYNEKDMSGNDLMGVVIFDLDNTLYNWVDFFAPCFRGMVHALARETGLSEETLYTEFKAVYFKRGSLEWAFSVQELPSLQNVELEELRDYIRVAKGVFKRVREVNLQAYPRAKETLQRLRDEGYKIVAATNSPKYHAQRRLQELKIDRFFDLLIAWEGYEIPDDIPLVDEFTTSETSNPYSGPLADRSLTVPEHLLKPNVEMYKLVCQQEGFCSDNSWVIGDSIRKDLEPGLSLGLNAIWAKYGTHFEEKNWETLLRITHWDPAKINHTYEEKLLPNIHIVEKFEEILNIVKLRQMGLPFD